MGRKPFRTSTNKGDKTYNFVAKQIILKGQIQDMFNFDRDSRGISESALGSEIISNHYRNNPPKGFKPKD